MTTASQLFDAWLEQARLPADQLTVEQRGLLHAAFQFRNTCGDDYYSTRMLGHFLLHCQSGLSVAQIARLLGISRPTASRQQGLSSKQTIQQAHHRMDGRPYGKLLPRYAGPIAHFLLTHPNASRADLIDFIDQTFAVRVSRIALYHFLKRYGLDEATRQAAAPPTPPPASVPPTTGAAPPTPPPASVPPTTGAAAVATPILTLPVTVPFVAQGQPVPTPAPPFSAHAPSTPALSC